MQGAPEFEHVTIGTLGLLEIRCGDSTVTLPAKGQPEKVIAVLSLLRPGERLSTSALAKRVGTTPGTTENVLTRLRRELKKLGLDGLLSSTSQGHRLMIARDQTNAFQFKKLRDAGREAADRNELEAALKHWAAAWSLWHGEEPLPGLSCPGLDDEIEKLKDLRFAVRRDWSDVSLRLGRHEDTLSVLRPLAKMKPLNEPVRELLIIALYEVEGSAEAVDAYDEFCAFLQKKKPGLKPRGTLQDLRKQIDAGAAALTLARWRQPVAAA